MKAELAPTAKGFAWMLVLVAATGCDHHARSGALVLTKAPPVPAAHAPRNVLDVRYPLGSRVVLRSPPFDARKERIISGSLAAAGGPFVTYDGERVLFVGKPSESSDWQIYQTVLAGWGPRALTAMPGGAMAPLVVADGSLVFISPVPAAAGERANDRTPQLFVQTAGAPPRQLSFSSSAVVDATILSDGRILYLTLRQSSPGSPPESRLYTINNDGTEITAFHQPNAGATLRRPRQIPGGRVAVIVSKLDSTFPGGQAEVVDMAHPDADRAGLFPELGAVIQSVHPAEDGSFLVCAEGMVNNSRLAAVFRVIPGAPRPGEALVSDPNWDLFDVTETSARVAPMGRLSTVDLSQRTGKILCLDANFTRNSSGTAEHAVPASRVRVTAEVAPDIVQTLGEITVQPDGSFLAEVPADVPIGFDLIAEDGRMIRRQAPNFWVRPGENRSCVGCHEPPNHSPRNRRPMAVSVPVPCLTLETGSLASSRVAP